MSKHERSLKETKVAGKNGIGHQLERVEVFDDNLLPEACEIERLKAIDPEIMIWLKERAEREQDFRHEAYNKKIKLLSKSENRVTFLNFYGILMSFLFLGGIIFFSYLIIINGMKIQGSIFSGATIVAVLSFLFRIPKNTNQNK